VATIQVRRIQIRRIGIGVIVHRGAQIAPAKIHIEYVQQADDARLLRTCICFDLDAYPATALGKRHGAGRWQLKNLASVIP
jgi:hypothetical protein